MNRIKKKEDVERIKKDSSIKSRENPMVGIPMINQRDMRTIVEFFTLLHMCASAIRCV